jgi:tetratricopeptide (TPR) repeat protein
VPSLSLPNPNDGLQTIEESEAVKLFMERATALLPDFEVNKLNASSIAQICQRLDGIALAIELAASRVKLLKVEQIASRLDDAFRLLTGGSRTALPRQQTLRALIDWSYNLLLEEERIVLRRLAVFVGGWTLEAAEYVCDNPNMLDLLSHLVDKSLVSVDREHGTEPRYYLLETIRQYAREKLAESGETGSIRDQHLAYFASLAEQAEPEVQGANQLLWLDRLEGELDNLRTALEWSLESGDKSTETGLRMASSLWWFWFIRNYHEESQWLRKALVASQTSSNLVWRANALSRLAWVAFFDEASADEGFALGQTLGPAGKESVALALLGRAAWANYQADDARAKSLFEESLKTFREIGNRWGMCEASTWLGMVLIHLGEHQQAMNLLEESLVLARQARDGNEIGFALWILGNAVKARGDYSQAITLMEESLALFKELKLYSGIAFVLIDLGKAALGQGNYEKMTSCYKEILSIYWNLGAERNIADGIELVASAFVVNQKPERAARLLGAAEALRKSSGADLFPYQAADYERSIQALHSQLDVVAFKACWIEGKEMNVKQAVEYALEEVYE